MGKETGEEKQPNANIAGQHQNRTFLKNNGWFLKFYIKAISMLYFDLVFFFSFWDIGACFLN